MIVIVRKISATKNPEFEPGDNENWIPGGLNHGVSLPIDYECEGHIKELPKVGSPFYMLRYKRNGVEALGEMITSPVESVVQDSDKTWHFSTANSVYEMQQVD